MKGLFGYGTYPDGHIGCPRQKTDMTPCVARDGIRATDERECVGCGQDYFNLFSELVEQCARYRGATPGEKE